MRLGIIYKATSPSGKVYIGKTVSELKERKRCHFKDANNKNRRGYDSAFPRAIRKYGIENLVWEILYENVSHSQLLKLEISVILEYDSFHNGYNSTKGGEGTIGYKHTDEAKAKMSKDRKGAIHTKESKDKMSKAKKGKPSNRILSKESRDKISGENHHKAKLTWNKVAEIRKLYKQGSYNQLEIASIYGVDNSTINSIIRNKNWIVR